MTEKEMIAFLGALKDSDWEISVSKTWKIKDVVAHLIGWTEVDVGSLENIDTISAFFSRAQDFDIDTYNDQVVAKHATAPPQNLLKTWDDLIIRREELMKDIDIEKVRQDTILNKYLLEGGNDKHAQYHYEQISNLCPQR